MEEYATSLSPIRPLVAYSPLTLWHRSAYALANPPKGIAKADSLGGFWDLQRPRARHGAPDPKTSGEGEAERDERGVWRVVG